MSVFSDLLSEYITMKDVGVYPLSQFCGLDRSFMYKIINGKRNPSGEDVVRKMAQFMQLTPREKTDFMDAFYITQMGEEVYYRRKSVGELIETFSHREGKKEYIFHEAEIAKLELNGGGSGEIPFRGTVHVRHAILQLFFGEAVKEDGKISVLVQPDFDFAMELHEQQREDGFDAEKLQPELSAENSPDLCLRLRLPCAVLLRQCDGTAE